MTPLQRALSQDPVFMRLWQDVEQHSRRQIEERAKADPLAFKLSRVFPSGVQPRYRYYDAGKNGRGQAVRFCWSTVPNVAGFFLGWREVIGKKGGKRDRWVSRRLRRRVKEIARERWETMRGFSQAPSEAESC